ncbi:hypothetical protein E2C01_045495 [Portunus trituberculatus]|uniref:Uncharacterized protein n=1 Tax=Portunus trituberculatus TaxID=210409 RepID=A0A5B7G577_PORTR|nr:hypothetical protein [Portunus trituberculatus]
MQIYHPVGEELRRCVVGTIAHEGTERRRDTRGRPVVLDFSPKLMSALHTHRINRYSRTGIPGDACVQRRAGPRVAAWAARPRRGTHHDLGLGWGADMVEETAASRVVGRAAAAAAHVAHGG